MKLNGIIYWKKWLKSNELIYYSPTGLSPQDRLCIHNYAENYDIYSQTYGVNKYVRVIVEKKDKVIKELNSTIKRKFMDDIGVKINMAIPEYYEYFVDLFGVRHEFELYKKMVENIGVDKYASYYTDLVRSIINTIKSTKSYESYKKLDENKLVASIPKINYNMLCDEFANSYYVSIDLTEANFRSLKSYDPSIVLNKNS